MADYYFGLNRDDAQSQMAVSTSTTGKDVEVAVTAAGVPDKEALVVTLQSMLYAIVEKTWPPA